MTSRVAIYARYSSDLQSKSSVEDQVAICNDKATFEGWNVVGYYTDAAVSGSSMLRPGIQSLLQGALNGAFDIVLAEAMDRLSRDQADIASFFKRMEFAGIKVFTLAEGFISTMHVGLKGTMNQLFLKDLALKTHRGLRAKIEKGLSGGGISYGYDVVKEFNAHGEALKGGRIINAEQASIVKRIFNSYAFENMSPKSIAAQLNADGVKGPSGKNWSQSTINGNRRRGTGILNNSVYRGKMIWNKLTYIKDPDTGKRVSRLNDTSEWITADVPELRIVSEELWSAVKGKQKELDAVQSGFSAKKRPQYLLSGLLKCGCCHGGYSKVNGERYGCAAARNKGNAICTNMQTIKRTDIEEKVLAALQTHLMREELVDAFCAEYTSQLNAMRREENALRNRQVQKLKNLKLQKQNVVEAIKNGVPAAMVKDDLASVCAEIEDLEKAKAPISVTNKPLLHPSLAKRYREHVRALTQNINDSKLTLEAREHLRRLIEKIVLTPKGDGAMKIDLHGDLAGILTIAQKEKRVDKSKFIDPSIQLVAGAGFEPTTFGL